VLDAELNSALNGESFKGSPGKNEGFGPKYYVFGSLQPVTLADIRF